jgi:hypothetical protein
MQSTEIYLRMDPTEKIDAIEKLTPPSLKRGRFTVPDKHGTGQAHCGVTRNDTTVKVKGQSGHGRVTGSTISAWMLRNACLLRPRPLLRISLLPVIMGCP